MEKKELTMLQALPLDIKIAKTKQRIREFINYVGINNVYVSFSGGKDSTVLSDIVRQVEIEDYGNSGGSVIPRVFCNTGLEYPEIIKFVKEQPDIVIIKPKLSFKEVIEKYGYPAVSKEVSGKIYMLRNYNISDKFKNYMLHGDERGNFGKIPDKWQFLIEADFDINNACCDVMKKRPFHKYEKETNRYPITGELAEESRARTKKYLKTGCNAFGEDVKRYKSTPLAFWTENDILQYIYENKLKISEAYGDIVIYETIKGKDYYKTTKCNRTGCIFCMFGVHLEQYPNRFIQLKNTHPELYNYCMRGGKHDENGKWIPCGGLGMDHVLNKLNIEH